MWTPPPERIGHRRGVCLVDRGRAESRYRAQEDRFPRTPRIQHSAIAPEPEAAGAYCNRCPHSSLDGKTPDQVYFNQPMLEAVAA